MANACGPLARWLGGAAVGCRRLVLTSLALAVLLGGSARGQADAAALAAELRQWCAQPRLPGQPGNLALATLVQERFRASQFTTGAIAFRTPVFIAGETTLTWPGAAPLRLYPMHPTLLRPGNFREPEFTAPLVDLHGGAVTDLARAAGTDLKGTLALLDYGCGDRWQQLLRFGARGFIFCGAPDPFYLDSVQKVYNTEAAVPRYYVTAEDGARLRAAGAAGPLAVQVRAAPSRWELTTLRDHWVLIPGADPELQKEVIVITAPLDANAAVPERAYGGQSAPNLLLLLRMLEEFQRTPPARSVLLVAVNAHTQHFLGERMLAWHLLAPSAQVEDLRNTLAREMRRNRLYSRNYSLLKLEPFPAAEQRLSVVVEMLWELDRQQQVQRQEAYQRELQARGERLLALRREAATDSAAAQSLKELEAADLPEPAGVLDLAPFGEKDYRAALVAVAARIKAEQGSWLSKLAVDKSGVAALADEVAKAEELQRLPFAELQALAQRVKTVFDDEKLLESWRSKLDETTGERLPIKSKLQDQASRNLNMTKLEMLETSVDKTLDPKVKEERLAALQLRRATATKVLVLFNKIDVGIGATRTYYRNIAPRDDCRTLLADYRDTLVRRFTRWTDIMRDLLETDQANEVIREALAQRTVKLVIDLDLNWLSDRAGFCAVDRLCNNSWEVNFGKLSAALARDLDAPPGTTPKDAAAPATPPAPAAPVVPPTPATPPAPAVPATTAAVSTGPLADTLTGQAGRPQEYYFAFSDSAAPYYHAAGGTPALALKSVHTGPGRVFGPDDTPDHLDAARVARLQDWLCRYFRALLAHREITNATNLPAVTLAGGMTLRYCVIRSVKVDEFDAKTTPSQEVPNCLTTLYSLKAEPGAFLVNGDVLNCYTTLTDDTGFACLYGLNDDQTLAATSYQLDAASWTVLHTIDKGQLQESKQENTNVGADRAKNLPLFACEEFPIYERIDPTRLSFRPVLVQSFWPYSGDSKSKPNKYGSHGVGANSLALSQPSRGPAAVHLRRAGPGTRSDRLILLSDSMLSAVNPGERDGEYDSEGVGYAKPEDLGPDVFARFAYDMQTMVSRRVAKMKGVSNQLVDDFLRDAGQALDEMTAAAKANRQLAFVQANYRALGDLAKAYGETRRLTADMLKAIVCYMALMLPFCFFLMKLLFNIVRIERQLLTFAALFIGTYFGFRLIHPAFRIAMNPEAIFIAFVLGAIGCFITWVMHARFESEMQLLFQTWTGMKADVAYGTVGQTALLIGVNNMKRRRIRTTLTTCTIVLVTFAMLAFSSVSKKMTPQLLGERSLAPYTGFFYHWPAAQKIDEETLTVFQNLFHGQADVIVRRVMQPASTAKGGVFAWPLTRTDVAGTPIEIQGLIGLPPEDRDLLGPFPLLQGRYFASPTAREALLPAGAAEALGIKPADVGHVQLQFRGETLDLVGLVDDDRYRRLMDLDESILLLPRKQGGQSPGQSGGQSSDTSESAAALAIDTSGLLLLPEGLAAKLGAQPFSITVRFPEDAEGRCQTDLWTAINLLLVTTQADFWVGSRSEFRMGQSTHLVQKGIYRVSGSYRTSIGGWSRLIIPLLIAGSIILNTMLGTVYERKNEIAVYNAIGLNPTHIFMFFLAEAFVYSVLGAVGGYLIGQLLAMAIRSLDLVHGVSVNFSSLMVVYVIAFAIALVMISTLYPAWVATRTAVPSGKRSWSLPPHDGQRMTVVFPFIYQPGLAGGVMYFLYEFFSRFTEKSLGDQIVVLEQRTSGRDAAGRPNYVLTYGVSLAPFDLGVTQRVTFEAAFDERVGCYRVRMEILRQSGQDTNWVTVNRPFLEKLRKLLMRWRNLDPTQHAWYVERARALFDLAQPLPDPSVTAPPTARVNWAPAAAAAPAKPESPAPPGAPPAPAAPTGA